MRYAGTITPPNEHDMKVLEFKVEVTLREQMAER